jgi:hypothetical protein
VSTTPAGVDVERLMRAIEDEVRRERRTRLLARGGPDAYTDAEVYALVERAISRAVDRSDVDQHLLLLPRELGEPRSWKLQTHLRFSTHRSPFLGWLLIAIKRRILLPLTYWLYEWAMENFRRQERVNRVLFAAVEELAIENARLRAEMEKRPSPPR